MHQRRPNHWLIIVFSRVLCFIPLPFLWQDKHHNFYHVIIFYVRYVLCVRTIAHSHDLLYTHGSLNVPIEHHPTIRYMVYNGYYKVMSNISKMGQLPTPVYTLSQIREIVPCRFHPPAEPKSRGKKLAKSRASFCCSGVAKANLAPPPFWNWEKLGETVGSHGLSRSEI